MSAPQDPSRALLFAADALGAAPAAERLRALRAEPVRLAVDPELAATRRGQVLASTAASLLGRLHALLGAVEVDAPGGARVLGGVHGLRAGRPLADELVARLHGVAPRDAGVRHALASGAARREIGLAIGPRAEAGAREATRIDGEGWIATLSPASAPASALAETPGSFNPFGPLVAAALGASEVGRGLLRRLGGAPADGALAPLDACLAWDLWSHRFEGESRTPRLVSPLDLGRIALVGLGAIGSAAAVALAQIPAAEGIVELIDDDALSRSNLERVLTASAGDVGRSKARVARRALARSALRPVVVHGRLGPALPRGSAARTLLVGVDAGEARRAIAGLGASAIYNGGTGAGELLVSRHVGLAGPCLACLYPPPLVRRAEARAADTGACARIEATPIRPAATIGFLSALCGFLAACELVKDRLRVARDGALDVRRPVFRLDVLAARPGPACIEEIVPRRDCACRAPRPVRPEAWLGLGAR